VALWFAVRERPASGAAIAAQAAPRSASGGPRSIGLVAAGTLTALAVALVGTWHLSSVFAQTIHVRWHDEVDGARRATLERRFALANGVQLEDDPSGLTWAYDLLDPSTSNIETMIEAGEVADTHEIDRAAARVLPTAPASDALRWAGQRLPLVGSAEERRRMVLVLAALAFAALSWGARRTTPARPSREGRGRWRVAFVCGLAVLVACGSQPQAGPLLAGRTAGDPATAMSGFPCTERDGRISCPLPAHLVRWLDETLAPDAVFAANTLNEYPPSLFLPQQFVGLGGMDSTFLNADALMASYMRRYRRSEAEHGGQPFFNDRESPEERRAFVDELGVTHVLIDPAFYETLPRILDGQSADFAKLDDRESWAVYRALRR
jgi:hypothetical protein